MSSELRRLPRWELKTVVIPLENRISSGPSTEVAKSVWPFVEEETPAIPQRQDPRSAINRNQKRVIIFRVTWGRTRATAK